MNLHTLLLTKNDCYKANRAMKPIGIMVHSTGANNPNLKRYVGPDDGLLGVNQYNNHWNTATPGGRQVCVHAFIGKLKDGSVATYQTLPWDICGWHSGSGSKGNANFLGYIGFEICEDALTDATYFGKVYREAIELCVYLCKKYGLTEKNIICHSEGHTLGIASNHGDVMHWFPKHGKSMDTFRTEVKAGLGTSEPTQPTEPTADTTIKVGSLVKITGSKYYGGQTIPSWVKAKNWYVKSIKNDRVVIDKSEDGKNAICSPVKASDLTVIGTTASNPTYRVHTVVHGDTLWAIAKKYLGNGSRYTEIVKLNGLTSNCIYSGQKLNIPN